MSFKWRSPEELKEIVKHDKPMQIFVMGMPRSGTMSLVAALKKLGYTPYDMTDRAFLGHLSLWNDALRAKFFSHGQPWGRTEFDRVFKGFDCVLDVPCIFFVPEFTAAYPDSLIILNKRDPTAWLASMQSTLFHVFQWRSWPLLAYLGPPMVGDWYTNCRLTFSVFCSNDYGPICKEKFLEHYDHVRQVVPKHRLLEYEVKEGWEPLCRFLGKEVPVGEAFPNVNDSKYFVKAHADLWAYAVFHMLKNLVIGSVVVGVVAAAWSWYVSR